jgi:hypothetical protein
MYNRDIKDWLIEASVSSEFQLNDMCQFLFNFRKDDIFYTIL